MWKTSDLFSFFKQYGAWKDKNKTVKTLHSKINVTEQTNNKGKQANNWEKMAIHRNKRRFQNPIPGMGEGRFLLDTYGIRTPASPHSLEGSIIVTSTYMMLKILTTHPHSPSISKLPKGIGGGARICKR